MSHVIHSADASGNSAEGSENCDTAESYEMGAAVVALLVRVK